MYGLHKEEGLDAATVKAVVDLFNKGKLSEKNIENELEALRKVQPK